MDVFTDDQKRACIAIQLSGLLPRQFWQCTEVLQDPSRFLGRDVSYYTALGLSQRVGCRLASPDWEKVDQSWMWALQSDCHFLCYGDKSYPKALHCMVDRPLALYAKGDLSLLSKPLLAMVGSRNCSEYGSLTARRYAYALAADYGIVSGLALGIDAQCHLGCLDRGGETIAVLGLDVATVYPKRHRQLYANIEQHGLLLSEMPIGSPYHVSLFPRRNRIITGLSLAVVVVEARKKSGALLSALFALEQGKEVYAIPGQVDSPQAQGCHWLIQQGAFCVAEVADIRLNLGG